MTTILTALPLLGAGHAAHAACVASPSPTFVCSGANTATQVIAADNAKVSTAPGFSVDAAIGNGVNISGDGHIRFTDENASTMTGAGDGLKVEVADNDGTTQGAVTIRTNGNITGGSNGIYAENYGSGALEITANGQVTGETGDGINAFYSSGTDLTITTGAGSAISGGGGSGIYARNASSGALDITANGSVTGAAGIDADNLGTDLTITTGAGSAITGANGSGIDADNSGSGALEITANGQVTGKAGAGIIAFNSSDGTDLTITTGAGSVISGGGDALVAFGIEAFNAGSGALEITANGQVTGGTAGIVATSYGTDLTITTGAGSVVTGGVDGISASNSGAGTDTGTGAIAITANGQVTGGENGIEATNSGDGTDLTITTGAGSVIGGGDDGIFAANSGSGDLTITANGSVTGESESGIYANNAGASQLAITVGATGLVQGSVGIAAVGQDISITNAGVVRNLSGDSNDQAIIARGDAANINNSGVLIGTVSFEGNDFDLNNDGVWNSSGGISDFGAVGSVDVVTNNGTFIAADDGARAEVTQLIDLEDFENSGLVSLADGGAGDRLEMSDDYESEGGRLAVDAVLGPGTAGIADQLIVGGSTSGVTTISVNVVDVLGVNLDGIPVVIVEGITAEEHFNLAGGVLNAGFLAWGLRLDGKVHELFTSGIGAGSFEFAAGITGAQDIWHQSTGTLLQRQADLRPLLEGTSVTPVADYAEPVVPTPLAKVTPGFWFKGVGGYLERDAEEGVLVLDRDQTIFGLLAGFDFGTENLGSQGDALLFGLFGGYLTSDLNFDSTNTEWTYEGPSVGVYATYLNHAFHADATVKADFLDVDIDADDLAPGEGDADTDVLNIGGRIDTGYKVDLDRGLFVEPQAALAVVHTEVDDIDDIFGGAVEFDDETSVRGRLGLRLGHELTAANQVIYSSDVTASLWQEFAGDNNATVFAPGFPVTGVSDDPGQTFGDVSIGFSAQSPEGWSSFLRANYQFADDYDAFGGNVGVRYAW